MLDPSIDEKDAYHQSLCEWDWEPDSAWFLLLTTAWLFACWVGVAR